MSYCKVCKEEIIEGSKFCVKCGTAIEGQEKVLYDVEKNKSKKRSKKMLITLITTGIIAIMAAITLILLFVLSKETTKVDIGSFIMVEYTGYDTVGEVRVRIDEDELITQVSNSLEKNKRSITEDIRKIINSFSYEISDNGKLKNGDTVRIDIKYSEDLAEEIGLELVNLSVIYTVEKLQELTEVDPFEYLDVEFQGYSGNGNIIISKNDMLDVIYELDFTVDKEVQLCNGDKVIISLDDDYNYRALRCGYKLSCTSKEYMVEDLPLYYETLKEESDSPIHMLMSNFIEAAYVKADLEAIKMLVDDVTSISIEPYKISQKYIELYDNIVCYTMETEVVDTYIVCVTYNAKLYNIETMVPSAEMYIVKYDVNEEKYYIHNLFEGEKLSDYLTESTTDVAEQIQAQVEKNLSEALNKDSELKSTYDLMIGIAKGSN